VKDLNKKLTNLKRTLNIAIDKDLVKDEDKTAETLNNMVNLLDYLKILANQE
jgi:hypothetical protein